MKLRLVIPTMVVAAAFAAGCGDEIDQANDAIDRSQEQVDRARDAVEDPAGAAEREIDKALEDAVTPEDQP
jgi:hypothetical protein